MKNALSNLVSILGHFEQKKPILMLDFDGVLSPLVRDPSTARISKTTHRALVECSKAMPVAIITGRSLSDIRDRVAIQSVVYAGSHGLEWKIGSRIQRKRVPEKNRKAFASVRRDLLRLAKQYPELRIEDKPLCLALGYRSLRQSRVVHFRRTVRELVNSIKPGAVRCIDNLFTFELIALPEWTKGECAAHIGKRIGKNAVPVYIGDGLTDEDAFRALSRGITIRVGRSRSSAAKYYFRRRADVDTFLRLLGKAVIHQSQFPVWKSHKRLNSFER